LLGIDAYCFAWLCAFALPAIAQVQVNVLTFRNDNARTGQNPNEPLLSPANVKPGQFGRRLSHAVDGNVFAEPLYVAAAPMATGGVRNIVLVVTDHDSAYAFDADDIAGADPGPLWQVSFLNASRGVTTVPWQDVNCPVIYPEIGITGTPVIDSATYTIYLVAFTKETASDGTVSYVHRLHALDIRSGRELSTSPVEIEASAAGTGDGGTTVTFVPESYKQRAALLLSNGVVYTAWSSECDLGQYHGWIIGYSADTLQRVAVYNDTPNGSGASFWGAGAGPAADSTGNLFVVSANGTFTAGEGVAEDLGDSIIRLSPAGGLTVTDYFTPFNQLYLSDNDLDLGSSGALLLPPEAGSAAHRNLLVAAGKEGCIYLIDRDSMGGYGIESDQGAVQTMPGAVQSVFGAPAYFSGNVYFSGAGDSLKAFRIAKASLSPAPASNSSMTLASPGSSPVISANGAQNGIVWALELGKGMGALHAFDAADLSTELFRDAPGSYVQFSAPMVADGKVFVGTLDSLVVYGLLPGATGGIGGVVNGASFNSAVAPGSLISIFGSNLSQATVAAQQIPLPISMADTSVLINGARAPLLYVSPGQINAQVPSQTATGTATVTVETSGALTPSVSIAVAAAAPEIFLAGAGRLLAFDQDGSLNTAANPAAGSSIATIFLTGFVTGQGSLASPSASMGNLPAQIAYAGPAPGTVGVAQINLKVPALPPGDYQLVVTMGGVKSNSGLISVK
jgi:uncharacterized protein (TIGR03437 family)